MTHKIALFFASCLILCGLLFPATAQADARTKKTILTTNAPIKIPTANLVLPPGKYVIKLLDVAGVRNIVQVFNEHENKLYATVLAVPNYRLNQDVKSAFTFWETPSGSPIALRSWFYPGDTYGVEFAYPKKAATEIARGSKRNIPTVYSDSDKPVDLKEARIGATTPEGKEVELSPEEYESPPA